MFTFCLSCFRSELLLFCHRKVHEKMNELFARFLLDGHGDNLNVLARFDTICTLFITAIYKGKSIT